MVRVIPTAELGGRTGAARFEGHAHGAGVSFFVIRLPEGEGPVLHRHPYEETFVILEGSATFTVDGETLEASADTIVVVPPGATHTFTTGRDGMRSVNIHPSARMVQENLPAQSS